MNRHKLRYRLIGENWEITRLNEFLKSQYGFDLYDFSHSLAIVLRRRPSLRFWHIWAIKKESIPYFEQMDQELRRLRRLRDRIVRDLYNHLERIQYWDWISNRIDTPVCPLFHPRTIISQDLDREDMQEKRNKITEMLYKLDETIIAAEIDFFERYLSIYRYPSGRPAVPKNIISSLWSMILRDSIRIHHKNITNLLNWFCNKLETTAYGRELRDSLEDGYSSEEEISRFKRRYGRYLEEDRKELFVFDYRTASGREKIYPFHIRFAEDEPKFYTLPEPSEGRTPSIKFPEGTTYSQ